MIFFWKDIVRVIRAWVGSLRGSVLRNDPDARMGWYVIMATIPIGIFGLIFKHQIETGARNLYLIGTTLIVLGLILLGVERISKRNRGIESIQTKDAVVVGLAQAVALIPGVSRSGATITAGLFMGLDRPAAARFSFLISIPAIVLAGLFELKKVLDGSEPQTTGTGA